MFASWSAKTIVLVPALIVFVFAAAVYMNVDMGTAPYDAIPVIIHKKIKGIPFSLIRILFDGIITVVAIIFGGRIGIVTLLMVFTLGPVIAFVGRKMKLLFDFDE